MLLRGGWSSGTLLGSARSQGAARSDTRKGWVIRGGVRPEREWISRDFALAVVTGAAAANCVNACQDRVKSCQESSGRIVGVVDWDGRLVGAVDREDILRGLVQREMA